VGDRLKSAWDGGGCGQGNRIARYLYDPDWFGNLVRIEQPGRDTVYEYDSFGRLVRSDGPAAGGDEATYSYDCSTGAICAPRAARAGPTPMWV
jgi:YD repeat-containing protein